MRQPRSWIEQGELPGGPPALGSPGQRARPRAARDRRRPPPAADAPRHHGRVALRRDTGSQPQQLERWGYRGQASRVQLPSREAHAKSSTR